MLGDAFSQALKEKNLEWTGGEVPKLILTADIVQYDKGDAFKRWLVPGWGATVLVVRGALYESDNRKVGSVDAKRTVDAGGAIPSLPKCCHVIVKLADQVKGSK